ncbi:MAG TPA: hypothetical protein VHO69_18100 [Phototrophicaceae bacterium]|nr:hypothetical protein [Phototrophicaceae bacterium]
MSDDSFKMNYSEGLNVFQSARRRAFWQEVFGLLRNKPAELLSFDDIKTRLRLREESYKGLQDVPLDAIVGSVGRYRDFTSNFLPKSSTSQDRWSRVYAQIHSLEGVPPIEVYKVGDVYFVRDGNHRVSVARQLDAKTIQAHVTELPTSIDLSPGMTRKELDAAADYALFLEETGLKRTRPHHQPMLLSEPSRYNELLGHIYLHQNILEHSNGQGVTLEEAAADWYDHVYRPAVTLIRKYDVLAHLPQRTEADLYLWMVDHLREVREEYGDEAAIRTFSSALEEFLKDQKIAVPEELRQEDDDSVILTRTQVMRAVELARAHDEAQNAAATEPTEEQPR